MYRAAFLALMAALLLACDDHRVPTELESAPPVFTIADGAHSGGNPHFFFLPPIVPKPAFTGTFDPSLSPVVEICAITAAGCDGVIAKFTMTTGPGSETVRLDLSDEQYIVNWHTDEFALESERTYRIRVLILKTLIGYADVALVNNQKEAKNLDTAEMVALVDGRTVPIKFRIEQGAVFVIEPPQPGDPPVVIATADGTVSMSIPEGALSEPVAITMQAINPPSDAPRRALMAGSTYEFGPDGIQFGIPISVTLNYDPLQLPANRDAQSLRLVTLANGRWEFVPGSRVDPATSTLTAELHHFSTYALTSASLITMSGNDSHEYDPACGLYAMYEDGTGFQKLEIAQHYFEMVPNSWSLDGAKLAYVASGKLYVTDGQVTSLISGDTWVAAGRPTWSPDGSTIAFQGWENIYVVDATGSSAPVQITHVSGYWAFDASWTPDGARIVFTLDSGTSSWNPEGQAELHSMLPDGSDLVKLTTTARTEWAPVYSPDGSQLAFAAYDYETEIWSLEVMDVATGATTTLVAGSNMGRNAMYGFYPRWTPDGRLVYSALNEWGQPDISTVHPDGTGNQVLIDYDTFRAETQAVCGQADIPGAFVDWQP